MDSDFSHDPASLPQLLRAAGEAAPGDRLALRARRRGTDWGPMRRFISRGGSTHGSCWGSASATSPVASGAWWRRVLRGSIDSIDSLGYAFQVEAYRAIEGSSGRGSDCPRP